MIRACFSTVRPAAALALAATALWLTGCASPSPYSRGSAPVVDRSSVAGGAGARVPGAARDPSVQVNPLDRPAPLSPEAGGFVLEDMPVQPSGPPTVQRRPKPAPAPAPAASSGDGARPSNEAVTALLNSASAHVQNRDLEKAAADLERALRIEPNNAYIWYDLGQIRQAQGRHAEAEAMFSKSNSMAGGDRQLQSDNWTRIAAARRAQGDLGGADAAEAKAGQLR